MSRSELNPKFATNKALLLVALILLIQACQRQSQQIDEAPDVEVALDIQPDPATTGEAEIILSLTDENGQPIQGAMIEVRGDMTHAGMVPVFGEAQELETGKYQVPFQWSMAGDWILSVTGRLPDGRNLIRSFNTQVQPNTDNSMEDM